jgi:ATP-dependent DNA helicase RecG
MAVIHGEMKRKEIQDALGLKHEVHFRDAYLIPSMEAGIIEMTIPDKPTSSKQKYRLTEKGLAVLQNIEKEMQ